MSDDLIISGHGETAVATDELLGRAQYLDYLAGEVGSAVTALAAMDAAGSPSIAGATESLAAEVAEGAARAEIEDAQRLLAAAGQLTTATVAALRLSAEAYGGTERASEAAARQLAAHVGYAVGLLSPLALLAAPGLLAGVALTALVHRLFPGTRELTDRAMGGALDRGSWLLNNPATVELIRLAVSSSDDAAAGFLRLPPGVTSLLGEGEGGAGLTGVETTTMGVLAAGGLAGYFTRTGTRVTKMRTAETARPPSGFAERVARIPNPGHNGGAQIHIERYATPGRPDHFEVYIAGTVTFSPTADTEPFDMTSNLEGVAGVPAASYRAAQQAMAEAGVGRGDTVTITGHSQGGLVAAQLAASGDYDVSGLFTIGAPSGHIELPKGMNAVAIEHADDLVPALAGVRQDETTLLVRRTVFDQGSLPSEFGVPAHERAAYLASATMLDSAASTDVAAAIARMDAPMAGVTTGKDELYKAHRTSAGG